MKGAVCPKMAGYEAVPQVVGTVHYAFALVESAALRAHEQVDERHLADLAEEIERDGVLRRPVVVDRASSRHEWSYPLDERPVSLALLRGASRL
ncbi:MAG: hypothetical protein HPY55_05575 [Firmicutes bacterium]|nr:hypothetical protein [Bacillota bacterium]